MVEFSLDHHAWNDTTKKPKNVPCTSEKNQKNYKFFQNYSSNCPSGDISADLITRLQIFSRKIRHFSAQSRKLFHKVIILFLSKCSSGHVKCLFDNSVETFRQSSKSFGSKCIFDDCWNISAGSSINFAWKTKLNPKTNTFLTKTPQNFLGSLKMQFQQKRRNFFSKLIIFLLESEVKKKIWEPFTKKPKKYFGHVECTFGNAAENFSQRSGQLSLKIQKLSKKSEKMILILKVVHLTRRKQFWQLCWKLFAGSSRHFCLRIQTEKKKFVFDKIFLKISPTFRMQYWQIWRNFYFRTKVSFARTRS